MIGKQILEVSDERREWAARAVLALAVLVTGCVSSPMATGAARAADSGEAHPSALRPSWSTAAARADASLDPSIPTPESVVGHAIGDGAVGYDSLVRYLHALTDASPLATLTPYAHSHEGRVLQYLTITSPANHASLGAIKADNAKLADPRTLGSSPEAARILDTVPAVAWMAYAIHGDELSSTDAAIQLAYQLVAGTEEATQRLRDELVIHIDPLMNPDGRERYLSQLQVFTGKVPNSDHQAMQHRGLWAAGRGNHYFFDLNRDWLPQVHPETQGRAREIIGWNPHLVVDSHEMGALDTYLFDPPREPLNANLSEANLRWRRLFSADQAKAFDRHGWSYYTQEWYEEWAPSYTNAWASLLGAIGILYEQAGVNAASVKQRTGQTLTYREAVHHQLTSSLANLESLRANRRAILEDYLADRRWAVSSSASSEGGFILPVPTDKVRIERFVDLLTRQGIELGAAADEFSATDVADIWGQRAESMTFPTGTLVVPSAQPHRRLLHAILDFDPHMTEAFLNEERRELENHRGTRVYDITAWNLCMAFGLEAYWAESLPNVRLDPVAAPDPGFPEDQAAYGYLIDGASGEIHRAIVRLLESDCKLRVAVKPFTIGGRPYRPGAVLLRKHENPDNLRELLGEATAELSLELRATDTALSESGPDLGGNRFRLLQPPRIAIASQWPISRSSFGAAWYLLDVQTGLRVSPISLQAIGRLDLRRYNVIVLPHAWRAEGLAAFLDERVRKKLRSWIEAGGTLIAIGSSAAFVAGEDRGLSSVRLRREVLDKLVEYEEAFEREFAARHVEVDPAMVWGTGSAANLEEEAGENEKPKPPADAEAAKRQDTWQRLFSPHGLIAATSLDPEHWLCFGSEEKLPVLLSSSYALMSKHPIATPVRLVNKEAIRLSGLLWPEARERWENTAYATVERVGRGQVILFVTDPYFRGYFEGTGRLFLNALILGPGLGTSQPVPW